MCKICEFFNGDTPMPIYGSCIAWSHKGVAFKNNPSKKFHRHQKFADYKKAILAKTNLSFKDSLQVIQNEDRSHADEYTLANLSKLSSVWLEIIFL